MVIERDGEVIDVPPRMEVRGSGSPGAVVPAITSVDSVKDDGAVTTVSAGSVTLVLPRVVGSPVSGDATLTGVVGDTALGALAALSVGSD
jgi:hypothetical protein